MEIQQNDNGKKGKFYVEVNGEVLAESTYVWSGENKIIIDHTEVDDRLAGKGIGKQLIQKAVDFAREKHIKIMPLCPFAKTLFDKIKDYQDVLF